MNALSSWNGTERKEVFSLGLCGLDSNRIDFEHFSSVRFGSTYVFRIWYTRMMLGSHFRRCQGHSFLSGLLMEGMVVLLVVWCGV